MYICKTCDKEFNSVYGLSAHAKVHKAGYQQHKINNANATLKTVRKKYNASLSAYIENPNICTHCKIALPYKKRHNKFCSRSCSATYNNSKRDAEHYKKLSKTLKAKYPPKLKVKAPCKPKVKAPEEKNHRSQKFGCLHVLIVI